MKWMKQKSARQIKDKTKSMSILRITLDMNSFIQDYTDIIAESDGEKVALYLKKKQIPIFIAKMTKDQFLQLCNAGDNLSPSMVKEILPNLTEELILALCQFLLSQRSKKLEEEKVNLFSF